MISLKRAYDPVASTDGTRFLVERLWPRGVKKTALHVHAWLKDVAPSTTLRRWFGHDPKKWSEFRRRYFNELGAHAEVLEPCGLSLPSTLSAAEATPTCATYY